MVIVERCREVQDKRALEGEIVLHTYEVVGSDPKRTVKYVCSDRFSVSQDPKVHKELREILGREYTESVVTLRPEVFLRQKPQGTTLGIDWRQIFRLLRYH